MARKDDAPLIAAFGKAVRQLRLASALSQEDLAFRSSLHRTYVADVERGGRNLSLRAISQIARGLDVPASRLLKRAEAIHAMKEKNGA